MSTNIVTGNQLKVLKEFADNTKISTFHELLEIAFFTVSEETREIRFQRAQSLNTLREILDLAQGIDLRNKRMLKKDQAIFDIIMRKTAEFSETAAEDIFYFIQLAIKDYDHLESIPNWSYLSSLTQLYANFYSIRELENISGRI